MTSGGRPLAAAGSFVVICAVVFWADFAAAGGEEKMAGFHRSVVKLRAGKRPILPLECEIRQATLQPRFHPLDTLLYAGTAQQNTSHSIMTLRRNYRACGYTYPQQHLLVFDVSRPFLLDKARRRLQL